MPSWKCISHFTGEDFYTGLLEQGTNVEEPFEQGVKAYLLGQSNELPDLLADRSAAEVEPTVKGTEGHAEHGDEGNLE